MKLLDFRLQLVEYLTSGTKRRAAKEELDTGDEEERIEIENERKMLAALPCISVLMSTYHLCVVW